MKPGDYVIATKWGDGDPLDHWCVGFYSEDDDRGRHYVVDSEGRNFRWNGFRRIKVISPKRGAWMLANAKNIEASGRSVWGCLRIPMKTEGWIQP